MRTLMMVNGLLFCLVFMWTTSAVLGRDAYLNKNHLGIQPRMSSTLCSRNLGGRCVSTKENCPNNLPLETVPGKPWCKWVERCCYPFQDTCNDISANCADNTHHCRTNLYVQVRCKKTCGFCGTKEDACKDISPNCAANAHQCDTNPYVQVRCRKTCDFCGTTPTPKPTPPPTLAPNPDPTPAPTLEPDTCNVDCGHYCYPSKDWPCTCPNFCNGTKQSPIDIWSDIPLRTSGNHLTFSDSYSVPIQKITITNNGHTVVASWDSSLPSRTISDGGLPGEYTLAQFHFHWGCKNYRGSEHTIDGTRFSMELHLVHYKTSYGNLKEALKYKDGLAVLGIFFTVDEKHDVSNRLAMNLADIIKPGSEKEIEFNVPLIFLIPTTRSFFRYYGSLTTPTCNEVVIWSVFNTPFTISEGQIETFRELKDKEGHTLCDNYRGIQPLNGREVQLRY